MGLEESDHRHLPSTFSPRGARQIQQSRTFQSVLLRVVTLIFCVYATLYISTLRVGSHTLDALSNWTAESSNHCSQADVLVPEKNKKLWKTLEHVFGTDAFKHRAIDWLSGAVKIPTESYDDMGPVGDDSRWDIFVSFHDYLLQAFPLVHTTLKLTKVNTYGLLYVWEGTNSSLKPIILAAHQDVVPVDPRTVHEWTHPPYAGHFDGEKIWGRGSLDDKSGLIGTLSSIESLLERDFRPTRTIVLAFGFDEEISGVHGAKYLSKVLLEVFGKNAFAFIIDEGGEFTQQYGSVIATPGIAEKGYMDVRVEVTSPGGHSSVPPKHTSIGILSSLLVKYEANPFKSHLTRNDPLYSTLQCVAEHGRDLPSYIRKTIKHSTRSDMALHALEKIIFKNRMYESLVGTTQAIDLIQGGVKTNALPEQAWAVVNHRIAVISSVKDVKTRDSNVLKSLAESFNLTYSAFGSRISEEGVPSSGTLTLSDAFHDALEPAPVTPTGKNAAPYQLLSGSIKAAYNSHRSLEGANSIVVAPGMMTGNTDTRYYWDLSKHIFRYNHRSSNGINGISKGVHTVNEAIRADSFVEMIRFFTTLILNADESKNL